MSLKNFRLPSLSDKHDAKAEAEIVEEKVLEEEAQVEINRKTKKVTK